MADQDTENQKSLRRSWVLLCAFLLLIVNVVIVATLFGVEYSAYNGSIEGTFIAISRIMAKYPGQWNWWPFWNGGMPFENSYLPFLHWIVAGFTLLTGLSAARSFHIVMAAVYALSALSVFWMALELSRKLAASFVASLAYSCVSLSALLVPAIGADAGGVLNLRRLQDLVFYGEAPHTVALALVPVAVVCFSRALATNAVRWKILAGVLAAFVALSNAFGIVTLAVALICWLLAFPSRPWWKPVSIVAAIGIVSYCWISPWLSPNMIRAIRANSSTAGGGFRYTAASWIALAFLGIGFLLLWWVMRRAKISAHLQFFALFALVPTGFVLAWHAWKVTLIPQAGRYELEMDMALVLAVVFIGAAIVDRLPKSVRSAVVGVLLTGLTLQTVHTVIYARNLIRSVEPSRLGEYKIAKWLDRNRPGERAFISGSASVLYNVFTDNPQLHGEHEQQAVNPFIPIVAFTIYSGMNAGGRDAQYSLFWLKAFGARAISVPGPNSTDHFKPFAHPRKFDGVLPLLWREGDDAIYEVPGRSSSLAHVIPTSAVVTKTPIHGLNIAPVEPYLAALDDPKYPLATFQWKGMSEAVIRATVDRGQVIAVQVTYDRGWEAWANGRRQQIRGDAIGQMVIEPDRAGPCQISLRYTGGIEKIVTRAMSFMALLLAVAYGWWGKGLPALALRSPRALSGVSRFASRVFARRLFWPVVVALLAFLGAVIGYSIYTYHSPRFVRTPESPLFPAFRGVAHQDFRGAPTAQDPALPDEVLVFYMTGLGPVTPAVPPGRPAPLDTLSHTQAPVVCQWNAAEGGPVAEVLFAGLAPGMTGIYQVSVRVPPRLTSGEITCRSTNPSQAASMVVPVSPQ